MTCDQVDPYLVAPPTAGRPGSGPFATTSFAAALAATPTSAALAATPTSAAPPWAAQVAEVDLQLGGDVVGGLAVFILSLRQIEVRLDHLFSGRTPGGVYWTARLNKKRHN